jgi:ABC-type transport system involved in multi-copper enzyme maturation permease subunit
LIKDKKNREDLVTLLTKKFELEEKLDRNHHAVTGRLAHALLYVSLVLFGGFVILIRIALFWEKVNRFEVMFYSFGFLFAFIMVFITVVSLVGSNYDCPRHTPIFIGYRGRDLLTDEIKEIDKEIIEELGKLGKQPEIDQEKNQAKEEKDEQSISNESTS